MPLREDEAGDRVRPATRRADGEETWSYSEAYFRALVQNAAGILTVLDTEGSIRYASPSLWQVLGYQPEALRGHSLFAVIHPDDVAQVRRFFTDLLRTAGITSSIQLRAQHCDGGWRHLEVIGTNLLDDQDVRGLVVNAQDVTEPRRIATELTMARRRLEESREAERLRLARELHDGAVQQLFGISYQLAEAQRHADAKEPPEALIHRLEVIRQEVLNVAGQLHGLIGELRPPGLEEFGLPAALEAYVARLQCEGRDAMPTITLALADDTRQLPRAVALCLFRIAQEALHNALRHARARRITIRLRRHPSGVVLRIRDDGCGFRLPSRLSDMTQADHFGLAGMTERADLVGGRLSIRSSPHVGTTVTVRLPVQEVGDADDRADSGLAG